MSEGEKAEVTRRKYLEYAVGGVIAAATALLLYYYAIELAKAAQAKRK